MAKLYKVLDKDGYSCHGGEAKWSLPTQNEDGTWTPGDWMDDIHGELEICDNGYHVVKFDQLIYWLNTRIFEVEVDGEIIEDYDKSVCRKCRLVRELTAWNERSVRLFTCDCAEHVLPIFERKYPNDNRPRKAIETARLYADGNVTEEELGAAWSAALAAARDAARSAALDAAEDSAEEWQTNKLQEYLKEGK